MAPWWIQLIPLAFQILKEMPELLDDFLEIFRKFQQLPAEKQLRLASIVEDFTKHASA